MYLSESEKQKNIDICRRNDVSYCGVFGSFARGEADENSDIDLLVRFSKPKGFAFFGIAQRIGSHIDGFELKSFQADGKTQDAVIRQLEIIGEATANLTPELREKIRRSHGKWQRRHAID